MKLDPVQLTRQLIDIESTTYSEGVVGEFLAEFLSARDFSVEKMHVASKGEDGATAFCDRFQASLARTIRNRSSTLLPSLSIRSLASAVTTEDLIQAGDPVGGG